MVYEDSLPSRLVDNLIRYGYDGTNSAALFEMTVEKLFSFMGYEAQCLGKDMEELQMLLQNTVMRSMQSLMA